MLCFEDFEVISILGTGRNATYYKVKNKSSADVFVWKAINYEEYASNPQDLVRRLSQRKLEESESTLKIHDYILHEESVTVYLIAEYCEHGSLSNIISKCRQDSDFIEESFLWFLVYKLAKLCKEFGNVNLHEVFVDVDYNVKCFNFSLGENEAPDSFSEMLHLLLHQQAKPSEKRAFPSHYGDELKNLYQFLGSQSPISYDAILCHPTALSKLNSPKHLFQKLPKDRNDDKEDLEKLYHSKLGNLRNREASLKSAEDKLRERQRCLEKREKKIALMERIVKEKVSRAELYLKRAREQKGTNSNKVQIPKTIYEKQDTSFSADCGESVIVQTSKKLNVDDIVKPVQLCRSMSERRVRFKSHSPLKEIHNIKRDIHQKLGIREQSDSDKTSETNSEKSVEKSKPKKFLLSSMFSKKPKKVQSSQSSSSDSVSAHTYEDVEKWDKSEQKPIAWTQESKRQAFDLLRMMNGETGLMQHTCL